MTDRPATGTILYSSWGYDQTNIDWFQVVKHSGKLSVELRQVRASKGLDNPTAMTGKCVPIPSDFIGPAIRRRWTDSPYGSFAKIDSYGYARPWEGDPKRYSEYA